MSIDFEPGLQQPIENAFRHVDGSNHHCGKAYPGDLVTIINPDSVKGRRQWASQHVGHMARVMCRKRQIPPWRNGMGMETLYYLSCECGAEGIVEVGFIEKEA